MCLFGWNSQDVPYVVLIVSLLQLWTNLSSLKNIIWIIYWSVSYLEQGRAVILYNIWIFLLDRNCIKTLKCAHIFIFLSFYCFRCLLWFSVYTSFLFLKLICLLSFLKNTIITGLKRPPLIYLISYFCLVLVLLRLTF